jgi:hypothetical protein
MGDYGSQVRIRVFTHPDDPSTTNSGNQESKSRLNGWAESMKKVNNETGRADKAMIAQMHCVTRRLSTITFLPGNADELNQDRIFKVSLQQVISGAAPAC